MLVKNFAESQYTIYTDRILGKGSFSIVYLGLERARHKFVAIKTEKRTDKNLLLESEHNILDYINNRPSGVKLETLHSYWYGQYNHDYLMVTDLMGDCLDDIHAKHNRLFSPKTVLMLAEQMLTILKYYHSHGVVHRDIKPNNFMFEYGQPAKKLILIDFGLAKKHIDEEGIRARYSTHSTRVGTLKYMSPNVHNYIEASCRDDLYSCGYLLLYLLNGTLPWQGVSGTRKEKHTQILDIKLNNTPSILASTVKCSCSAYKNVGKCSFTDFFLHFFEYTMALKYDEDIDYRTLLEKVLLCMKSHDFKYDYLWDWS
jgi:serine/threonine protein kinase